MRQDSLFNIPPHMWHDHQTRGQQGGRSTQHPRDGSDTMLKSNGPNSISKDKKKDK